MDQLFQITNVFAVTNGLLTAALGAAETGNDWLKSGLSLSGIIISILWIMTSKDWFKSNDPRTKLPEYSKKIATYLPRLFVIGWGISASVHIGRLICLIL